MKCTSHSLMACVSIGLATALLLYVFAYLALVLPEPIPQCSGPIWPRYPTYRVGGPHSEALFAPISWVDQKLFPRRWEFTLEEQNRYFNGPSRSSPPTSMVRNHGSKI